MKKKLAVPCALAACLAVFLLGFLLAGMTIPRSFEQLPQESAVFPPAQAGSSFTILRKGTYPSFSDEPVSAEQAAPSQRLLRALREQKYTWAFPLIRPQKDGLAIYELTGCTPECKAYWDGRALWLPKKYDGPWQGYVPSSPDKLEEALDSLE